MSLQPRLGWVKKHFGESGRIQVKDARCDAARGRITLIGASPETAPLDIGRMTILPGSKGVVFVNVMLGRNTGESLRVPLEAIADSVSVRDAQRRRGLYRTTLALAPAGAGVGLSDLVLCCGDPAQIADQQGVRIEANLDGTVGPRGPLVVYFEIYRLTPDAGGLSRFRYEYEVKRWTDDRSPRALREAEGRPPVDRWVSRDETHSGPIRRQFVRVQTESLMPGRHQVRVRVRDLVARAEAERTIEFVME